MTNGASVDVTKADREAAAAYVEGEKPGERALAETFRCGAADEGLLVQAFARHRLSHPSAPASADVKERARELLAATTDDGGGAWILESRALRAIEAALSSVREAPRDKDMERAIFNAISDPGQTVGFKTDERTLTQWQTDAVMRVLSHSRKDEEAGQR